MDPFFAWLEATALSIWLREDLWAFPVVLILHTVGLAFLAGVSVALDARLLGVARGAAWGPLGRYFTVMWAGFWLNAVSGLLLLIAYPTKALTNPVFYVKLAAIAAGLLLAHAIRGAIQSLDDAAEPRSRRLTTLAVLSLACWALAIVTGRLLAYTHTRLTVDFYL